MMPRCFSTFFVDQERRPRDDGVAIVATRYKLVSWPQTNDSFVKNTDEPARLANVTNIQLPTPKPKLLISGTDKNHFVTTREASKQYNIKPGKLRELCRVGILVSSKSGSKWLISLDSLMDYLRLDSHK